MTHRDKFYLDPDDRGFYVRRCARCGARWHLIDGCCECEDRDDDYTPPVEYGMDEPGRGTL